MHNGTLLMTIGALHQAVGLAAGSGLLPAPDRRNLFREIAEAGIAGAIGADPARNALFWFLFFGFLVLMIGGLVRENERAGRPPPAALGWQLGALAAAGCVLIPASGFWLVLPVAARIVWKAHADRKDAR